MPLDDTTRTVEIEIPFREERALVEKMLEKLTPGRWCKGALFKNRDTEMCMVGALNRADGKRGNESHTSHAAQNVRDRILTMIGVHRGVAVFNDAPGTTQEMVVNLLKRVLVSFS